MNGYTIAAVGLFIPIFAPGVYVAAAQVGWEVGKAGVETAQTISEAKKEVKQTVAGVAQQQLIESADQIEVGHGSNSGSSLLHLTVWLIGLSVAIPGFVFTLLKTAPRFVSR